MSLKKTLPILPTGYVPIFAGYNSLTCFANSANDYIYVYRYADYPVAEAEKEEKCTNKWNSGDSEGNNSGCYDPGTDCRVELKDPQNPTGGINIICCD